MQVSGKPGLTLIYSIIVSLAKKISADRYYTDDRLRLLSPVSGY